VRAKGKVADGRSAAQGAGYMSPPQDLMDVLFPLEHQDDMMDVLFPLCASC
jgi:hypothetical protein